MDHDKGYTEELLGLRALDRLSDRDRDMVDRHLADCVRCREKLAYIGQAAEYLARLDRHDVDDLVTDAEPEALRADTETP